MLSKICLCRQISHGKNDSLIVRHFSCLQLTNVEHQTALRAETEAMASMEKLLRDSKDAMEAYLAQYDALFRTIQHLSSELERQLATNAELKQDNAQKLQASALVLWVSAPQAQVNKAPCALVSPHDTAQSYRQVHHVCSTAIGVVLCSGWLSLEK